MGVMTHLESLKYSLLKHVFVCSFDNHLVFLDLRHDKYICVRLDAAQRLAFCELLSGWPLQRDASTLCSLKTDAGATEIAEAMVRQELLTLHPQAGKDALPVAVDPPAELLLGDQYRRPPPATATDMIRFASAVMMTLAWLRWRGIERIVRALEQRKLQRCVSTETMDLGRVRGLVLLFHELRLFVPVRRTCLFDSLCLINFLSLYDVFPTWVFGVRIDPLYAHCWVQERDILMSDALEGVLGLKPIMAV